MKAIIIENEYTVDESILAFLKDNPNLFESVQEELYCLHRNTKYLVPENLEEYDDLGKWGKKAKLIKHKGSL